MKKRKPPTERTGKIIYWITTGFLSLGMLAGGVQQLLQIGGYVEIIVGQLGYPIYVLSILGFWKILGVVAILIPKTPSSKRMGLCRILLCHVGSGNLPLGNRAELQ